MRHLVLACAFAAAAAAGSTAQASVKSWYCCMFGGPFVGDYCDGGIGSGCNRCCDNYSCGGYYCAYGCAGCNAGMNGGFYRCPTCLESLRSGRRCATQTRCAPAPCKACPPSPPCNTCAPPIPAAAPPTPAPVPPTVAPAPATPMPTPAPTPAPAASAP